jgi:hypothetical protein
MADRLKRKVTVTANDGSNNLQIEIMLKSGTLTESESDRIARAAGNLVADAIRGLPLCDFAPDNTVVEL